MIRIPNRVIDRFLDVKERVREQIRAGGVNPSDAGIFVRMIEILDNAVTSPPLPDGATPDHILLAIQRCLDLGRRSLDSADHLEAMFRTQFPAEYAASARGSPDQKTPKTLEEYEASALGNPDQKDGRGDETPADE